MNLFQNTIVPIILVGTTWGCFEATVGYFLHLLPIRIGFLIWYPVAVFFLLTVHRATGKKSAVLLTAALAAMIKLFNLLLPGRIDRVVNPAVSIFLEGIAVFVALYCLERLPRLKRTAGLLAGSILMNLLWRALYLCYLAFFVPVWIREASILQNHTQLMRFMVIDQLCSSTIVWLGALISKRFTGMELKPLHFIQKQPPLTRSAILLAALALNITLQMML